MNQHVLVIGCGSIGQRHIRNLRSLGIECILAFDPVVERMAEACQSGAIASESVESALAGRPAAVIICTPPHLHVAGARTALEAGAHVFVEKPIAATLDGVEEVLESAICAGRIVYVGYNFRFHAGLRKLKELLDFGVIGKLLILRAEFGQYLPDWRRGRDYRQGYTAHAEMGGGIILDASHEIDYARWLAGEVRSVFALTGKVSDLEMDAEDTGMLTVRFASGAVGQIHMDCVQRGYTRNCKLVGSEGTLTWEFKEGVRLCSSTGELLDEFPLVPDTNEMYLEEMRHFLTCVRGEAQPLVSGTDGKRVLEIALAARQAAIERREVTM